MSHLGIKISVALPLNILQLNCAWMNNLANHISLQKIMPRCYASLHGVTGRWGLLPHAPNAVGWLATQKVSKSSSKAPSLRDRAARPVSPVSTGPLIPALIACLASPISTICPSNARARPTRASRRVGR